MVISSEIADQVMLSWVIIHQLGTQVISSATHL